MITSNTPITYLLTLIGNAISGICVSISTKPLYELWFTAFDIFVNYFEVVTSPAIPLSNGNFYIFPSLSNVTSLLSL